MVAGRAGWLFLALGVVPFGQAACGGSSVRGDDERNGSDGSEPAGGVAGTGSVTGGAPPAECLVTQRVAIGTFFQRPQATNAPSAPSVRLMGTAKNSPRET